jgi:hypothetical protein
MKSRMEKHYNGEIESNERTKKNQELYDTIYNLEPINDISELNNNHELDLSGSRSKKNDNINREEYQKQKEYNTIINTKKDNSIYDYEEDFEEEAKIYDINSILDKAREKRNTPDEKEKYRTLRNTQYDILSKLNINKESLDIDDDVSDEEKLRELIHTITINKRKLNNISNDGTSDLLAYLKPMSDNTIVTEAIVEETKTVQENSDSLSAELKKVDKSFFTNSFTFSAQDFEGESKIDKTVKKNNGLIKVLIFILLVVIATVAMFLIKNYL